VTGKPSCWRPVHWLVVVTTPTGAAELEVTDMHETVDASASAAELDAIADAFREAAADLREREIARIEARMREDRSS
jgi:hypothetical protein